MPPAGAAILDQFGKRVDIADKLIPDGVSDNAAIIQQYLDDPSVGEVHIGKPGTYCIKWNGTKKVNCRNISGTATKVRAILTIPSNKALTGVPGVVLYQDKTSNACPLMNASGHVGDSGITISDLKFVGDYWYRLQSTADNQDLYYGYGPSFVNVTNCVFRRLEFENFSKYAFYVPKAQFCLFDKLHFSTRSDCFHLNGPFRNNTVSNLTGASRVAEKRFVMAASAAGVYTQGEEVRWGTVGVGNYISAATESGPTFVVYVHIVTDDVVASGSLQGQTSGQTRSFTAMSDTFAGDNGLAILGSEGQYYQDFTSDANKDVYCNTFQNILFDSDVGTFQPVRLVGTAADTIRDNRFINIAGKSYQGSGITIGDDTTAGSSGGATLEGCTFRNNIFEGVEIQPASGSYVIQIAGIGFKSASFKDIRSPLAGDASLMVYLGANASKTMTADSLIVDGIEASSTIRVDSGAGGTTTIQNITLRNVLATIAAAGNVVNVQGSGTTTIGRLLVNGVDFMGQGVSNGAVVNQGAGTITNLQLSDIRFRAGNQTVFNQTAGTCTNILGTNVSMSMNSTSGRLLYINGTVTNGQFANVSFDAGGSFANAMVQKDSTGTTSLTFNNLYTTGNGALVFYLNSAGTLNVNTNGWTIGTLGGSSECLRSTATGGTGTLRLSGSGYVNPSGVTTPIGTSTGIVQVNNRDFRCNPALLTGVQGDCVWSLTSGGALLPASAGPAVCEAAGAPGVADWDKNGRAF